MSCSRVDEAAAEDRAIAAAVAQGVKNAGDFILSDEGIAVIIGRAEKLLEAEINSREREIKAWRGVGIIPKKMKKWELKEFVKNQIEPQSVLFVEEQRTLALLEAKSTIGERQNRHLEEVLYEPKVVSDLCHFVLTKFT
jgi:hypothetical protein